VKKLAQFEERLQIAMYHIERGTMTTTPGSWCKWCDAKSICHSFKEVSKLASGPLQNLARDTVSTPSPAAMTTEEISKVLKNAVLIKLWADSVAEYATKIAKEGSKIPGYKLIQKKGNLAWKDESVAVKRFKERYGDDIFKKTLLTPTQMKKLVGKESAHEVEEIAERADKDLALVPESDKGEPVVINRLKVFDQFSNDVLEDL
jgi:aspartate/tyrosine/aromatic aminotransferase